MCLLETDRNHLEQSQDRMASRLRAPPPMLRSVRCVPAYDVVSGDTYLEDNKMKVMLLAKRVFGTEKEVKGAAG